MKACDFCEILEGKKSASVVYETSDALAFLDIRPLFPGHVLVIPKRHAVVLGDLYPEELAPYFAVVRLLSRSVPIALAADGCFTANNNIVSQSVPHLHHHVIPRRRKDGLKGFFWPRVPYDNEDHMDDVARRIAKATLQEDVLDFWFGPLDERGVASPRYHKRWFQQKKTFDQQIMDRFERRVEQAVAGQLLDWAETPRGSLALILLCDQFTRNMYRHTRRAFEGDELALQVCLGGIKAGFDRRLTLEERVFFYLPLEHAENAELQAESLRQFHGLLEEAPEDLKPTFTDFLHYAQRHAEIIAKFGRYPHRNKALDRAPTPDETAFLEEPGSSFW